MQITIAIILLTRSFREESTLDKRGITRSEAITYS